MGILLLSIFLSHLKYSVHYFSRLNISLSLVNFTLCELCYFQFATFELMHSSFFFVLSFIYSATWTRRWIIFMNSIINRRYLCLFHSLPIHALFPGGRFEFSSLQTKCSLVGSILKFEDHNSQIHIYSFCKSTYFLLKFITDPQIFKYTFSQHLPKAQPIKFCISVPSHQSLTFLIMRIRTLWYTCVCPLFLTNFFI